MRLPSLAEVLARLFPDTAGVAMSTATVRLDVAHALTSPAFLTSLAKLLSTVATTTIEKASPDYTIAHKASAELRKALGLPEISTPTASAAEPLAKALLEGLESASAQAASTIAAAMPEK